jgi:alkane 1-monooxygenase
VDCLGVGGELITKNLVDDSSPRYTAPLVHDLILYSAACGLLLSVVVLTWSASARDLFGLGAFVNALLAELGVAYDVLAARGGNSWLHYLGAGLSVGGLLGVTGIATAHELTHRTAHPFDLLVGRWVFALMFGTNFATEHVYGHHKELGHPEVDPVTPKRGVGFYHFLTVGQWRQWRGGFGIEAKRLRASGKSPWSVHNRVLHAYARGTLVGALIFLGAGWTGLACWLVVLAFAKYILEGLNFFSHYGMVRAPGEAIGIRHTYSSYNPLSNHFLFNLGRHGAHHAYDTEYYLLPFERSPTSTYGYLTMTVVSWIPPLFWKLMIPTLKDWDEHWATPAERALVAQQNRESGIRGLMEPAGSVDSRPATAA